MRIHRSISLAVIFTITLSNTAFALTTTTPSQLCTGSPCRNLWVSATDGSDSNNCLSEGNACLTIGRTAALATNPGDTINIKAGTYNTAQPGCAWFSYSAIACIDSSGTSSAPITVQSAPGHEGDVILDGGTTLLGIGIRNQSDYVIIRNLEIRNTQTNGIFSSADAVT